VETIVTVALIIALLLAAAVAGGFDKESQTRPTTAPTKEER
jgi:hypothetical protein